MCSVCNVNVFFYVKREGGVFVGIIFWRMDVWFFLFVFVIEIADDLIRKRIHHTYAQNTHTHMHRHTNQNYETFIKKTTKYI